MYDHVELIQLAQQGDEAAKERLIKENSGLIWSIVKRFAGRGYEMDDLYQIGAIGLLKCIEKFDVSYEVKFSTYAVPMIMGEIKRFLRDDGMIKISRTLKETYIKAKHAQQKFAQAHGRQPTVKELTALIDVPEDEILLSFEAGMEVESLHSTIYQKDGTPVFLMDKLEQERAKESNLEDSIMLKEIIRQLSPKERQIIMLRYFNDKTQSEIAKVIGISQVQVSRIEKKILNSIREKFG